MPVLPLVGSSSSRPGSSSPAASAASTIASATRSLVEPVGFWPSSLAYSRTSGFGESRGSSTRGVLPTRSRREDATLLPTGHGREQDDGRVVVDRRLEAVLRPDVLAFDVDVHERRQIVLLEQLPAQGREAAHQVVQELTHGSALGLDLSCALGLRAERGRDPYPAQCPTPWQNST